MEENNSSRKQSGCNYADLWILGLGLAGIIVAALFFLIIYSIVLGLCGGAIYFGAKLGSSGQIGKKTLYNKAQEFEATKQEHLEHLDGETDELKQLVTDKFDNDKMNLYREDDLPQPLISINGDAMKTAVKKVVTRAAQKMKERAK